MMDAIGGVFVGGVAATGGYGSVLGTFVGIFVIMLLKTGLPYVGLQANWQQIITGLVLIVAVLIDIIKEKESCSIIIQFSILYVEPSGRSRLTNTS